MILKLAMDISESQLYVSPELYDDRGKLISLSPAFNTIREALEFAEFAVRDTNGLSEGFPVTFTYSKSKSSENDIVFLVSA